MRKLIFCLMVGVFSVIQQANAADGVTAAQSDQVLDATWRLSPMAGMVSYRSPALRDFDDFAAGFTLSFNLPNRIAEVPPLQIGLETGVIYSPVSSVNDSNVLVLPAVAQVGYEFAERFLLTGHAGGNLFIQDDARGIRLDNSTDDVELVPSLGLSVGYAVFQRLAITARADWSFVEGANPFIGTLGLTVPLT